MVNGLCKTCIYSSCKMEYIQRIRNNKQINRHACVVFNTASPIELIMCLINIIHVHWHTSGNYKKFPYD